jgi:chromosome partitioning protein
MGTVISIANQKGGVGKTTTAFNLGWALSALGSQVLLVDNDPQGNLTSYAMAGDDLGMTTIDEVYVNRRSRPLEVSQFLTVNENLRLLPADSMLAGVEYYLMSRPDKEYVLKNALAAALEKFHYIIIDNPPALNLLTVNGLVAANGVIVPVQLEYFSLEGIVLLQKMMDSLKDKNPDLRLIGIVPNMFDDRRKLNWEVLEALKKEFGDKVFATKIHDSVKIAESSGHGQSIIKYSPSSRSSAEYLEFAKEVMENAEA